MTRFHLETTVKTASNSLDLLSYEVKSLGHLGGAENTPVPKVKQKPITLR